MFREDYVATDGNCRLPISFLAAKFREMFAGRLRYNPLRSNLSEHCREILAHAEDGRESSAVYSLDLRRLEGQEQRMEVSLIDLFKNLFTLSGHLGTRIFVINREEIFSEQYFMDGIKSGLSNYENYEWKRDLTVKMAEQLIHVLPIKNGETILDFGCSRGYLVKALDLCGVTAYGKDISSWAISNCDASVKDHVSNDLAIEPKSFDWIVSKDVCEHIPNEELDLTLLKLIRGARKGVFIIVPLTDRINKPYLRAEDNQDISHEIRWPLEIWLRVLTSLAPDFTVEASYHIPGLKPASSQVPFSCGFFTLRRIK